MPSTMMEIILCMLRFPARKHLYMWVKPIPKKLTLGRQRSRGRNFTVACLTIAA